MLKLLILIERSNLVAEYVGKNGFESAPVRTVGSSAKAFLRVSSPNSPCVSRIVNSRQSYCTCVG